MDKKNYIIFNFENVWILRSKQTVSICGKFNLEYKYDNEKYCKILIENKMWICDSAFEFEKSTNWSYFVITKLWEEKFSSMYLWLIILMYLISMCFTFSVKWFNGSPQSRKRFFSLTWRCFRTQLGTEISVSQYNCKACGQSVSTNKKRKTQDLHIN